MGWTKGQIVDDMFGELALAGYDFDITPDEKQAALRKLDTMMLTWYGEGLQIGYLFGLTPDDSDLDQDSGLPGLAVEAAVLNGAMRLAAGKGKALAASTKSAAKAAKDSVVMWVARSQVQEQQLPCGTPAGAGNRPWRQTVNPFLWPPCTSPLGNSADGELTFLGT